jgi:diphthamide synthase (EF-2-diphthine--ammonia ligase)
VSEGVTHVAFGDLFLADIRAYRERMLAGSGLSPLFPLWQANTRQLAREMIESGLRAVLVCVDPKQLSGDFAGRTFDDSLLVDLPPGVDPCGENGEFHTFCCAGPMFEQPIAVCSGSSVERDGFVFSDLVLDTGARACA